MLGEAAARLRPRAADLDAGRQDEVGCPGTKSGLRLLEGSAEGAACAQRPGQVAEEVLDARNLQRPAELVPRPAEIAAHGEPRAAEARLGDDPLRARARDARRALARERLAFEAAVAHDPARVHRGLGAERPDAVEGSIDVAAGILAELRRVEMLEVEL